jgi:hypothetical protein
MLLKLVVPLYNIGPKLLVLLVHVLLLGNQQLVMGQSGTSRLLIWSGDRIAHLHDRLT